MNKKIELYNPKNKSAVLAKQEPSLPDIIDDMDEKPEGMWEIFLMMLKDMKSFMTAGNAKTAGYSVKVQQDLKEQIYKPLLFIGYSILTFLIIFNLWGFLAPIDHASVAQGQIQLSGKQKTIQHPYGGIIKEIAVQNGENVSAGQKLIELDSTQVNSELDIVLSQLRIAKANMIRLLSQRDGFEEIDFSAEEILRGDDSEIASIIENQIHVFTTERKVVFGRINAFKQRIEQFSEKSKGLSAQLESYAQLIKLKERDVKRYEELAEKKLAREIDLSTLQSELERLYGSSAEIRSEVASTEAQIDEIELEILNVEIEFMNRINLELRETQVQVANLQEQYIIARDKLTRTVITASDSGVISDMQFFTIGGVIQPGAKIMNIVPQDDLLIVEAKIRTSDIESIVPGLHAKVQLAAFKNRIVPRLSGEVIYVSAHIIQPSAEQPGLGPAGSEPFYLAHIRLSEEELNSLKTNIRLQPGMPAMVFIVKGPRTLLEYMLSPIIDSFYRAFKEA